MALAIPGIHHVTALARDPQRNLDFYTSVLGLRFIKKTINFDLPDVYHLYYGDSVGHPGTILTFFPWDQYRDGRPGAGQSTAIAMAIPAGSTEFWTDHLHCNGVAVDGPVTRFDQTVVAVSDPDGIRIELAATEDASDALAWDGGSIPAEHAIRGVHSVTLTLVDPGATGAFLTDVLGFEYVGRSGDRHRYVGQTGQPGSVVDLVRVTDDRESRGKMGAGAVHHVAWRTTDDAKQLAWMEKLSAAGVETTPVKDRQYFHSIYFNEPGGVIFEIATDGPGFTIDESVDGLGSSLKLPPWYEDRRADLERSLPALAVR